MSYKLIFKSQALKEWNKLGETVKNQFKKRLKERLANPKVESARLNGLKNCYKIKLASAGYRLVYEVRDNTLVVCVVVVGKRERHLVYKLAAKRI